MGCLEQVGPRFAKFGSFEFEYGEKWKQLYEMKKQKLEALEREMKLEEDKLIAQMEYARYEHETETLKQQLQSREDARERNKNIWMKKEQEMEQMFEMNQQRKMEEEQQMLERMRRQDEGMRQRTEENNLFLQAQELNSMLDDNVMGMDGMGGGFGGGMGGGMGGGQVSVHDVADAVPLTEERLIGDTPPVRNPFASSRW